MSLEKRIKGVQKAKDALTQAESEALAGVRDRIQAALDNYLSYARGIGINNPMMSPAEIFARADVTMLWNNEVASLYKDLGGRMASGYQFGVGLGQDEGITGLEGLGYTPGDSEVNSQYLANVLMDLQNYLGGMRSQVEDTVWKAYNSTPWLQSYQQGGTSTNVPHDTAVERWNKVKNNQSVVVSDINRRATAGISVATHRGYTDGQASVVPYGAAGSLGKMWVANFAQDPKRGPCLTCIALHGTVVGLDEEFPASLTFAKRPLPVYRDMQGPPRHPNCKCKTVFVPLPGHPEPEEVTEAEAVSSSMQDYATEAVVEKMVTEGFTSAQVREMEEPLWLLLWKLIVGTGWWRTAWNALKRLG